jgi:hypothetical protein
MNMMKSSEELWIVYNEVMYFDYERITWTHRSRRFRNYWGNWYRFPMVESTDTNNPSPDKTPPAKKKSRLFDKLLAEAESNNDFWRHCKDHNDGDSGIDVSSLEMSMSTTMKGGRGRNQTGMRKGDQTIPTVETVASTLITTVHPRPLPLLLPLPIF